MAAAGSPTGTQLFYHISTWIPSDIHVVYVSNVGLDAAWGKHHDSRFDEFERIVVQSGLVGSPLTRIETVRDIPIAASVFWGRALRFHNTPSTLGVKSNFAGCLFLLSSQIEQVLSSIDPKFRLNTSGGVYFRLPPSRNERYPAAIAVPESNLLMLCSDEALAHEIMHVKNRATRKSVAWFQDIPKEWVDVNTPIWEIRRFKHGENDPTSPFSPVPGILPSYKDEKSIAMTFAIESEMAATVNYITADKSAIPSYEQTWGLMASARRSNGDTIITMKFNPSLDVYGNMRSRILLMLLGMLIVV